MIICFDFSPSKCGSLPFCHSLYLSVADFICSLPCCFWLTPSQFGMAQSAKFPGLHLLPSLIFWTAGVFFRKSHRNFLPRIHWLEHKHVGKHIPALYGANTETYNFYFFIYSYKDLFSYVFFLSWVEIIPMNNLKLLKERDRRGAKRCRAELRKEEV